MSKFERTAAVIAVFGSTDEVSVTFAEEVGFAIASRKQIVLTGGKGTQEQRVRDSAIRGARRFGESSPWIGVLREATVPSCFPYDGGFVIDTDLGHRRNYLEACLCDAAIGLEGGEGTSSEVTCALSLHKPVVLLGDQWRDEVSLDDPNSSRVASMVDSAFDRFGGEHSGNAALDKLLTKKAIRDGLRSLPPHTYFPLPPANAPKEEAKKKAAAIVDWILESLRRPQGITLAGHFPDLNGYEECSAEYEEWLAAHAT